MKPVTGKWQHLVGIGAVMGLAYGASWLLAPIFLTNVAKEMLGPAVEQAMTAVQKQQSLAQQTVDTLVPPVIRTRERPGKEDESFPTDISTIEKRLWSVIPIDSRINHQVFYGAADGSFVAVRRVAPQNYQIIARKDQQRVQTTYRIAEAVRTEPLEIAENYYPPARPWYRWAVERGTTGWAPIYSDFVSGQTRQVLVKPVYRHNGSLQGIILVDSGIAPYSEILQRVLPADDATAYLINQDELIIASASREMATSDFQAPIGVAVSSVRPAWISEQRPTSQQSGVPFRVTRGSNAWAMTRAVEGPYGARLTLLISVPETAVWKNLLSILIAKQALWMLTGLAALLLLVWYRSAQQIKTVKAVVSRATDGWASEAKIAPLPDELKDIAERVQSLNRQLRTDALTGVLNRATFVAQVEAHQATLLSQPALQDIGPAGYTLLFIDLNGFKAINDTHGHQAGDRVLKQVARRLKQAVRRDDAVSRFGGDEFVIYLHGVQQAELIAQAGDKLRTVIEQPIKLDSGIEVFVGGAIGVAVYPRDAQSFDELARVADERMYDAKRALKSLKGSSAASGPQRKKRLKTRTSNRIGGPRLHQSTTRKSRARRRAVPVGDDTAIGG